MLYYYRHLSQNALLYSRRCYTKTGKQQCLISESFAGICFVLAPKIRRNVHNHITIHAISGCRLKYFNTINKMRLETVKIRPNCSHLLTMKQARTYVSTSHNRNFTTYGCISLLFVYIFSIYIFIIYI